MYFLISGLATKNGSHCKVGEIDCLVTIIINQLADFFFTGDGRIKGIKTPSSGSVLLYKSASSDHVCFSLVQFSCWSTLPFNLFTCIICSMMCPGERKLEESF
jgi:hypothetical protein